MPTLFLWKCMKVPGLIRRKEERLEAGGGPPVRPRLLCALWFKHLRYLVHSELQERGWTELRDSGSQGDAMHADKWRRNGCWWRLFRSGLAEGGWPDEYITCLYFFQRKGLVFPLFTPAAKSLINCRPSQRESAFSPLKIISRHFQYLSAPCMPPLTSDRAGLAPDALITRRKRVERKQGKEIPLQMWPPFLSLLSPFQPPNLCFRPVPGPSMQGRKLGPGDLSQPSAGQDERVWDVCSGEKAATVPTVSQSHTDSHVWEIRKREEGRNEQDPECLGVRCRKWHPADEHNNSHCLLSSLQFDLKHKEPGKVLLALLRTWQRTSWSKISWRDQSPSKNINKVHPLIYRFSSAVDRLQIFRR